MRRVWEPLTDLSILVCFSKLISRTCAQCKLTYRMQNSLSCGRVAEKGQRHLTRCTQSCVFTTVEFSHSRLTMFIARECICLRLSVRSLCDSYAGDKAMSCGNTSLPDPAVPSATTEIELDSHTTWHLYVNQTSWLWDTPRRGVVQRK